MFQPSDRKRIFASVTKPTFINFLEHVKKDGVVDSDGRADMARALEGLVTAYAEGRISLPAECWPAPRLLSIENSEHEDSKWNR